MVQIFEKLHYTSNCRCDFRQNQLDLQESRGNENSFQFQVNPSSIPLHSEREQNRTTQDKENRLLPKTAGKKRPAMRPSMAFDKAKLLDASWGSEEDPWQKMLSEEREMLQVLHETNQPDPKNHSTGKIPVRNQGALIITDNMNYIGTTNTRSFLIQEANPTTGIIAKDQNSEVWGPQRSHASRDSTRTKPWAFANLRDKMPSAVALTKVPNRPTQPEEIIFSKGQRTSGASIPVLSHPATCKPKTRIVFLKVHKSASSTVMNILFRFGETHDLTFALPVNGASQLYYPFYFTAASVEGYVPGKDSQFDIMCHHMRFFEPEVAKVMGNTSFYFAILRNPVYLMESSFNYYKGTSSFAKAKSLEEFLNQTSRFYNASARDSPYAKNLMTFDFGYNNNGNFFPKRIQLTVRAIEAKFDLLLISEYFDESMVLLKKLLCWDLDDVVSFPLNSRHNSSKNHLSESTIEQIKNWNKLDWELYVHFNRTFWEKIDLHIGQELMQQEVKLLQQRRKQLAEICLQEGGGIAPKMIKDRELAPLQYGKAKILGYNLKDGLDNATRQMCQSLVTPELQYSKLLYRKQFPKKALKLSNSARLANLHYRRTV
ncbi:galactose-3-O-sulfotransferase 2 [Anolis carolinensis]|uniref:Galactose-3-O-sulfotransferase 2 n=1 Tax=Anolis carolinensis TaxID=28377 RepID=G1KSC4_ANOCA|nr:PREDICTED: galactose-3-O-sulfotransferase 2 isoform X2 [Anolis carolinensis]XP_008104561.1 PREDICTED: galactose-3-O-sulfotransferase 2 isoform X2 [Anolis carolinensis]|eukprot:XP_008104560.1 PREDICTED: galactose-3-O-sulfotransferase 2 isoform X2 [Anolis carolinensis]